VGRGVKKKSSSHGSDNDLARSLCSSGKAYPRAAGSERSASPRALVVVSLDEYRISTSVCRRSSARRRWRLI
jgi:hypothetical protein